ncbi:hypothetical protein [Paracoccus sp. SCSIO 75233]|uniref:hypothetical protein n=1 Tax=Paracoccus sp. SCSIO 75233 TaxID=3017782 RepID=UPI0022F048FD|nr:hypothetical protein [Paracoccus sp. SCSIO 75233]WBU55231.1 hypothetical protein PAF12_17745 [Paracoccus sp. SCSIO 75233]
MEYDPVERLTRFPGLNHDFSEIHALSQMPGAELHETKWHLVIYVPGRDRLVFCFDNIASITAEGPRQPWGMALVRKQGWGVVGVVPKLPDWYRSPELFDVLEDMRDRSVFAAYPAVSMFGTSMGAFAATVFAPLAPGCTVLGLAPQSSLAPDLVPFEDRYDWAVSALDWTSPRYRDAAEGVRAAGKVYFIYDRNIEPDRMHVDRMRGDNVIDLRWRNLTHKVPPRLRRMGILEPIALEGLAGTLTRERYFALLRKRRDCPIYLVEMLQDAVSRGHLDLAKAALATVPPERRNWRLRQMSRIIRRAIAERDRAAVEE